MPNPPSSEPFTPNGGRGGGGGSSFSGNRREHGRRLEREYDAAFDSEAERADSLGTYITFTSFPGLDLALESLDPQRGGEQPELVSVAVDETEEGIVQRATVYIPDGKKEYFIKRISEYIETVAEDKARHAALVEGIWSIRRATIQELWTEPRHMFPPTDGKQYWWEVWLRRRDGNELQRFNDYAQQHGLPTSEHFLGFGDRTVALLRASTDELALTFEALDDLAELRRPHEVASILSNLAAIEQAEWVDDLRCRMRAANLTAPAVCVLDTGVQDGHPLLVDSLTVSDIHVADPHWSKRPVSEHGTEMAGLALFGNLYEAVIGSHDVQLKHRIESVKFLPDSGANDRDLYGAVTARAVDRPEIEAGNRPRVFLLAVTAPNPIPRPLGSASSESIEAGKPTSWSATIDALAYGRGVDDSHPKFTYLDRDEPRRTRLFVVSTGNIRDVVATDDHLSRSDLEPVEDPGQAWNALTVGAYTAKDDMSDSSADFDGYTPIARSGELTPVSRTSVVFNRKKWPFKPDVVAEGGNVAASPDMTSVDTPDNLAVLTTRLQHLGQGAFTTTRDTSAATAQVAALAADIMAEYPSLRVESVRALIVHSAEWTPAMVQRFDSANNKTDRVSLLRRYGMGVPDTTRALRSAADALTLILESQIHPYQREGNSSDGKAREMNLHAFPWPKAELEALGNTEVRLRITLSYFIEPNPSSRGWTGRYIYPSYGLRFAMRRPEDSIDAFRRRINTQARDDGEMPVPLATEKGWLFGATQQQSAGSLHTDIWTGPAIELASKEAIAVYPVAGWWKNRPAHDQSEKGVNYSLIVSIESPSVEVDLWTPIALQIAPEAVIEV